MYDWRIIFYAFSLILSTILSLVVVFILWRRRTVTGALSLAHLMAAIAIWAGFTALETTALTQSEKIFWSKMAYIGIVSAGPCFFMFAVRYTSTFQKSIRWLTYCIWVIPAFILALTFTNEYHNLIWTGYEWLDNSSILVYHHGIGFWVNMIFIYSLISIATGALLVNAVRNRYVYRRQSITLLIGVPIPVVWNVLYVLGLSPLQGMDLTPVAFALTGLIICWGIYRVRLFDLSPVESDFIIDNIGDGVVILDAVNRVVEINPAAQRMFKMSSGDPIGKNLVEVIPQMQNQVIRNSERNLMSGELAMDNESVYLEYFSHQLVQKNNTYIGQVLIFRDITSRKAAEMALRESEQRYQDLIEQAALPVVITDPRTYEMLFYNRRASSLLDISSRNNRGLRLERYFLDKTELQRIHHLVQKNGLVSDYEAQMTTQVGRVIWVVISANLTHYESSQNLFLTFSDITSRKLVEESEKQERVFAEALSSSVSALNSTLDFDEVLDRILTNLEKVIPNNHSNIMMVDENGIANIVRARGYDAAVLEKILAQVHLNVSETPTFLRMAVTGSPVIVSDTMTDPIWMARSSSAWIRSYLGAPIHYKGKVIGYINLDGDQVNMFTRIHMDRLKLFADQAAIAIENARLFEKIEQMAIIDTLTGLYNRRHFFELSEREFERYKRYNSPFSLVMLDLDHFKNINDQYGHAMGDLVLQQLADIFASSLRKMDIPGRIGGEEFIILLPETNLQSAQIVAERLRKTLAETTIKLNGFEIRITASMGVVAISEEYENLQAMISTADQLMYLAKQSGRNKVMIPTSVS